MKNKWIWIFVIVIAVAFWTSKNFFQKSGKSTEKQNNEKVEGASYWTCPMHPQIHSEKAGECPICHMKLVQVKAQQDQVKDQDSKGESRSDVIATDSQTALLGVQKYAVEKMDLTVQLPVSGRFLSSSSVAFQVYESDLRYVKPGLAFKGESSFYPEEKIVGTISSVDSIVDPTSRTVRVVGSVKKGPQRLFSETSFRGEVEISLKDKIAIPESSVLHTGSGDLVYIFGEGNKLSAREVKLGPKTESFYEVLSGLKVGEVISSGPNFLIDSEAKIRGVSNSNNGSGEKSTPSCPEGQHWDIPMAMCMPGKG
ncbi:MAG: heavy metal-binding domain-containing protein [Pseudobdellovibrionaceae bacterium]